ncbi:hypothetical protein, conserved [Eimeria tenella]|uniref:Uncharacterized protein n=1 Tax=Eimeria tenella TaxID=5802 RepID=U6L6I3_EIMTE|nr:hypothetical protein, conserved [Eimeria tenella]CDJ44813.1 hypothetical protein, conserved [Eimeria tenella]|eukprot:XP_013235561.1 hypothetical protein, conserved [Eimeria tenella]
MGGQEAPASPARGPPVGPPVPRGPPSTALDYTLLDAGEPLLSGFPEVPLGPQRQLGGAPMYPFEGLPGGPLGGPSRLQYPLERFAGGPPGAPSTLQYPLQGFAGAPLGAPRAPQYTLEGLPGGPLRAPGGFLGGPPGAPPGMKVGPSEQQRSSKLLL